MKLKKEFIIHNTGDNSMLVPTGAAHFSGMAEGLIWKDVSRVLSALREVGAINE